MREIARIDERRWRRGWSDVSGPRLGRDVLEGEQALAQSVGEVKLVLGEPGIALRFRGVGAGGRNVKLATKDLEGGRSSLPPTETFRAFSEFDVSS